MAANIQKIINLYSKYGVSDYIGESITQIEHAVQCAELAIKDSRLNKYDDYIRNCVIVSALLHDIGHLVGIDDNDMQMKDGNNILGIVGHEGIGSSYLKQCGMPSLVCDLVGSHVMAKRYLCTTLDTYYNKLSNASRETMKLQGGLMNNDEIKEFQMGYLSELKIYIREYDDEAKKINIEKIKTNGIEHYTSYIKQALLHGCLFV
jgi:predicted HD phosphohydrolase